MSVPYENVIQAWMVEPSDDQRKEQVKELLNFSGALHGDEKLRRFFMSPRLDWQKKEDVLNKVKLRGATVKLLKWIDRANLWFKLDKYAQAAQKYLNKLERFRYASVTSAIELSTDQIKGLQTKLGSAASEDITLEAHIDPAILGGLIVDFRGKRYDSSVKGRVQQLKKSVLNFKKA